MLRCEEINDIYQEWFECFINRRKNVETSVEDGVCGVAAKCDEDERIIRIEHNVYHKN